MTKKHKGNEELFNELSLLYKEITGHNLPEAKKYKKGEQVFTEGQVPKGVYYIKNGSVKITRNGLEKKGAVVRLALPHDFIGYLSLLKNWDYHSTATAIETSEVYFIPKQVFLKAIQTDLKFANLTLEILCSRIESSENYLVDFIIKSAQQRLATLLLTLCQAQELNPKNQSGMIQIPKKEIAYILNIKPETLSRNLTDLCNKNVIKSHLKQNSIEVVSKEKLLEISEMED